MSTIRNICPNCSVALDDIKDLTVTVNPPTITHTCGYSATIKDYNTTRAQRALDACQAKYPDMYQ